MISYYFLWKSKWRYFGINVKSNMLHLYAKWIGIYTRKNRQTYNPTTVMAPYVNLWILIIIIQWNGNLSTNQNSDYCLKIRYWLNYIRLQLIIGQRVSPFNRVLATLCLYTVFPFICLNALRLKSDYRHIISYIDELHHLIRELFITLFCILPFTECLYTPELDIYITVFCRQ